MYNHSNQFIRFGKYEEERLNFLSSVYSTYNSKDRLHQSNNVATDDSKPHSVAFINDSYFVQKISFSSHLEMSELNLVTTKVGLQITINRKTV